MATSPPAPLKPNALGRRGFLSLTSFFFVLVLHAHTHAHARRMQNGLTQAQATKAHCSSANATQGLLQCSPCLAYADCDGTSIISATTEPGPVPVCPWGGGLEQSSSTLESPSPLHTKHLTQQRPALRTMTAAAPAQHVGGSDLPHVNHASVSLFTAAYSSTSTGAPPCAASMAGTTCPASKSPNRASAAPASDVATKEGSQGLRDAGGRTPGATPHGSSKGVPSSAREDETPHALWRPAVAWADGARSRSRAAARAAPLTRRATRIRSTNGSTQYTSSTLTLPTCTPYRSAPVELTNHWLRLCGGEKMCSGATACIDLVALSGASQHASQTETPSRGTHARAERAARGCGEGGFTDAGETREAGHLHRQLHVHEARLVATPPDGVGPQTRHSEQSARGARVVRPEAGSTAKAAAAAADVEGRKAERVGIFARLERGGVRVERNAGADVRVAGQELHGDGGAGRTDGPNGG
eukprot:scaffold9532_cov143-Isochrysis_galbana.AAC.2